ADANGVTDPEACYRISDGGHFADNFMAGDAGIQGALPFGTHLMQVGMAHAAIGDLDLDIVGTRCAALDIDGFKRLVRSVGAVGSGGHDGSPVSLAGSGNGKPIAGVLHDELWLRVHGPQCELALSFSAAGEPAPPCFPFSEPWKSCFRKGTALMLRLLKFLGVLLLALLIIIAAYIGVNWAPDKSVDELAARWAQPPSQFVEVMGMQVHLRDEMAEGADPNALPVVLLHGTSDSLHTWQGWTDTLSRQRRVIRFDLPGFGLTGPFPEGDYRMAHYTQFVLAMLDKLDVPRAILAGNSFGGQLAWETAYVAPERVAALVLVDAAGYLFETQSMPIGFRIAQIPGLNEL